MKNLKVGIIIFAVILICIIMAPKAYATDIDEASDFSVITGATITGNTITLTENVTLADNNYLSILSGTYTLDLNGYTLSGNNNIVVDLKTGTLIINDNSEYKTGKIQNTRTDGDTANQAAILTRAGSLTINGGTFQSEEIGIEVRNTIAIINNGTFLGESIGFRAGDGTNVTIFNGNFGDENTYSGAKFFNDVRINGGIFKGYYYAVLYRGSTLDNELTINGGTFGDSNNYYGLDIYGGTILINTGEFIATYDAIYIEAIGGKAINLTINNLTATSSDAYGMSIEVDSDYTNYEINVQGGTYTGKYTGLYVYDDAIQYVKLSGGRYVATATDDSDNYGGIHIWSRTADNSERSIYTLNSLLKTEYNYSNTTFVEKLDVLQGEYYNTSAKDISVVREKNIIVKNDIENGTISAKSKAIVGEEITLTVTPADGYKLKAISVLDKFDEMPVTVTNSKFTMPNYDVYIGAEFELINPATTYNIVVGTISNGTITANKVTAYAGEEIALTVTPDINYKLKAESLKVNNGAVTVTNNKFTMPSTNVTIAAEFELDYTEKTITKTNENTTVSLKGIFSGSPVLVITETEKGNSGYDSLFTLVKEGKIVIGSYDISITGGTNTGEELELTFEIGKEYDGQEITIYHKLANGEVETKTVTVKDGKAKIEVNELSPFMLVANKAVENVKDKTPKTGDNHYIGIAIVCLLFVGIAIRKNKNLF